MPTHIVENQPPPLADYNLFTSDAALAEAVEREAPGCDRAELVEIGDLAGRPETIQLGFDANANPPELHTHDRFGNRIDEVRFHPAWHALMQGATQRGLSAAPWRDARQTGKRCLRIEPTIHDCFRSRKKRPRCAAWA